MNRPFQQIAALGLVFVASFFLPVHGVRGNPSAPTGIQAVNNRAAGKTGLRRVYGKGRYRFIDGRGNLVIPGPFYFAGEFRDGLALVEINRKYGFINTSGKVVILPQFQKVMPFEEDSSGKYVFFQRGVSGGVPGGDFFRPVSEVGEFSEGLAGFRQSGEGGGYGFIDTTGKIAIEPDFEAVGPFSEGLAKVKVNGKWGFINKTGKLVIPAKYLKVDDFSEGLALVNQFVDRSDFIDPTGAVAFTHTFSSVGKFRQGLARIKENDRYGFIDKKGKIVVPCDFSRVGHFFEGFAFVRLKSGLYGFIDLQGKMAIPATFREAGNFSGGLAPVATEKGCGFVNQSGKLVIPDVYDYAETFSNGLARVQTRPNWGFAFIGSDGRVVWSAK